MLFNSYEFILVFLPATLALFHLARRAGPRPAMLVLVAASLAFYAWWEPVYLLLLVGSLVVNYGAAVWLLRRRSRLVLAAGLAFNLGLLGWFKYAMFLAETAQALTGVEFVVGRIILPLGISFFTFQKIAFLVDCWRGEVRRVDWLDYSLFIAFFPQLIAGPIVRPGEIFPQFAAMDRPRDRGLDFAVGLSQFSIGLAKKVVLADNFAPLATPVFAAAAAGRTLSFAEAWTGALAYTFQIYFDFSGYSDMALGLARLFGFALPLNFQSPYKATSIVEFWRRWHMTLSRFLRDYLYVPLGGNRRGTARRYANLLIVMLLGGLWHGANWTFAVWGGLHGVFLAVNHLWRGSALAARWQGWTWRIASWALTFLAVVSAWVVFRAESFGAAGQVWSAMFALDGLRLPAPYEPWLRPWLVVFDPAWIAFVDAPLYRGRYDAAMLAAGLAIVLLLPNTQQLLARFAPSLDPPLPARPWVAAWRPNAAWALILGLLFAIPFMDLGGPSEFLYFQF